MVFNLRARVPRLAGQPSTFYVLLNALIFTALIHYWSGWAWSGRSNWANSPHEHDDDGHVAPPPPVQQQPPPPKPVAPAPKIVETPTIRLPAFCDVCGPEDVWCSKFGSVSNTGLLDVLIPPYSRDILARSRSFEGSNTRLRRVLREAQAGKTIKISVLGGSVTRGQGVNARENWFAVFGAWWKSQFPNGKVILQNGAVAATGTGYMSMCFKEHIDDDSDIVLTEFAINDRRSDGNTESFEWVIRQLLEMSKKPAVVNLQVFGIGYSEFTTGGDVHSAVAQYYGMSTLFMRDDAPLMYRRHTCSQSEERAAPSTAPKHDGRAGVVQCYEWQARPQACKFVTQIPIVTCSRFVLDQLQGTSHGRRTPCCLYAAAALRNRRGGRTEDRLAARHLRRLATFSQHGLRPVAPPVPKVGRPARACP